MLARRACGSVVRTPRVHRSYSTALAQWNTPGAGFTLQPTLVGEALLLRPLAAADLEPLYRCLLPPSPTTLLSVDPFRVGVPHCCDCCSYDTCCVWSRHASDKLLWADHPANDRYNRPVFEQWFKDALDYGSTLVAVDNRSGDAVGSSRYYLLDAARQEVAIGFTWLARPHWGGITNAAMKGLMLAHAFEQRVGIRTVWFHVAPGNTRSQIATSRIGAALSHREVIPALGEAEQLCFKITRDQYRASTAHPES
jgi:RimJ/RimL family protein N-acetyltransferase